MARGSRFRAPLLALVMSVAAPAACSRGSDCNANVFTPDAGGAERPLDLRIEAAFEAPPDTTPDLMPDAALATNPTPWQAQDIGGPGAPKGQVAFSNATVFVTAAGGDVGGKVDAFTFVSYKTHGDFDFSARVKSLQMVDPLSKAGLMVRASEAPGAVNAFLTILGDTAVGGRLQFRAAADGDTEPMPAILTVRAGQFLRLVRTGRTITAYRSSSSDTWFKLNSVGLDLPEDVQVGIAVSSNKADTPTISELDFLHLAALSAYPPTRGWNLEELGTVGSLAVTTATGLVLAGMGDPFMPSYENGAYLFSSASGSQSIVARIAGLDGVDPMAKIGVAIREGLAPYPPGNGIGALLSVTRASGVQFRSRTMTGGTAMEGMGMPASTAPLWLRLDKVDDPKTFTSTLTGHISMDGVAWTRVDAMTATIQEPFTVGLLAHGNGGTSLSAASITDLSVKPLP